MPIHKIWGDRMWAKTWTELSGDHVFGVFTWCSVYLTCDLILLLIFNPVTFNPTVNRTHSLSYMEGRLCNTSKEKRDAGQMQPHMSFPWMQAVTWQPWALSVVVDMCVLAVGWHDTSTIYMFSVSFSAKWSTSKHCRVIKTSNISAHQLKLHI